MKSKIISTLTVITCVVSAVLLFFTLLFGVIRFRFTQSENLISGVCANIDTDIIKNEITSQIDACSTIYRFDGTLIKDYARQIDVDSLVEEYFEDYYNAFKSGKDFPKLSLDCEELYQIITDNTDQSKRPEIYELEENRRALAEKYTLCISIPVSSLSLDILTSNISTASDSYSKISALGNYFSPILISFAVIFIGASVLTILFKKRKIAYFATLSYFVLTLLFSVPFVYLANANLPEKFNVKLGAGFAYLDATYKYIFNDTSNGLIIVSVLAFALFIASVIWNALTKIESQSERDTESNEIPMKAEKRA